ncbi:MAG: nucleotidyltransferase family protein [Rhodocyclaceae bacterium]|nr:MAG: nucleotidyltransferase family protein [Rhodocyclaceae bacterium]
MKAMILAAGRGERMRPLTDTCPKPLLQVGGKPLIVWQVERLVAAGITALVINHAHLGSQIEASLGDGRRYGARITYSRETEPLESAGGVVKALHLLGPSPFLIVSADIYVECDYRRLAEGKALLQDGTLAFLWLVANPAWHARGDFALVDGFLQLDREPRLTYANIGIFHPNFFAGIEPGTKYPLLPLFNRAIAAGMVRGAVLGGLWDNIGTPLQLAVLDEALKHRV